ncbi:MAG: hypothetical protein JXR83_13555 [Deltaproteobacteria bacterium]|nr:hypothetical protein [Deltaproteobacteria bacterium]
MNALRPSLVLSALALLLGACARGGFEAALDSEPIIAIFDGAAFDSANGDRGVSDRALSDVGADAHSDGGPDDTSARDGPSVQDGHVDGAGREVSAERDPFDAGTASLIFDLIGPTSFDPELTFAAPTSLAVDVAGATQYFEAALTFDTPLDVSAAGPQQVLFYFDPGGGALTRLRADRDNLIALPQGVLALTELRELYLFDNDIPGSIPVELGALTSLGSLYLSLNQLTGEIPPELGSLVNLTNLNLYGNQLTGSIPAELGALIHLYSLDLSHNQLSGPVPSELGRLTGLGILFLNHNQLSGSFPGAILEMASLHWLQLVANQFSGPLPAELGDLVHMDCLLIGGNSFTGSIPAELGNLTALTELGLNGSQFSGAIPAELGNLTRLHWLFLDDNQLTGAVPAELGNLVNLTWLHLNNNQLTGIASATVSHWTSIRELLLQDNLFSEAAVDAIIDEIWSARASYGDATAANVLDIGGSNAAPSGSATDPLQTPGSGNSNSDWSWNSGTNCHRPLTGKARAFDLAHDVCGDGFQLWTVTCTP